MNSFQTWDWVALIHFLYQFGSCIKLNYFVAHMFYTLSFSNDTSVPIAIYKIEKIDYLNTYTTVFNWG